MVYHLIYLIWHSSSPLCMVNIFYRDVYLLYGIYQIHWLIDWCLTPTLAVFQLYRGVVSNTQIVLQRHVNILKFCCCLFFFDVWILITPWISSNSSRTAHTLCAKELVRQLHCNTKLSFLISWIKFFYLWQPKRKIIGLSQIT